MQPYRRVINRDDKRTKNIFRNGGKWRVVKMVNGKRHDRTFPTFRAALAFRNSIHKDLPYRTSLDGWSKTADQFIRMKL